jgi:hypothetical protein
LNPAKKCNVSIVNHQLSPASKLKSSRCYHQKGIRSVRLTLSSCTLVFESHLFYKISNGNKT